jgi:Tol biopolymer transport system component
MRHGCVSWALPASVFIAGCGAVAPHGQTSAQAVATVSARPHESQIAVIRVRTGNPPRREIIVTDPAGTERRVLMRARGRRGVGVAGERLAWSPDGHWLAFTGEVGSQAKRVEQATTDLFVVRADGSDLHRLTHTGSATEPTWSPDGRMIVFAERTRNVGGSGLITDDAAPLMRVNRDGTHLRQLTPLVRGQIDSPGSFSPDGTRLVFTRLNLTALEHIGRIETVIETMGTDGTGLRQLVAGGGDPTYSPNGRRIAFVSNRDRNGVIRVGEDESEYANELYVINADGTEAHRLTRSPQLSEFAPTWSPDGTRIAYARQAEGFTKTIAVINANGSCGHEIAGDPTGAVWYTEPSWRPGRPRVPEGAMHCSRAPARKAG